MPKRPRSHVLGDEGEHAFRNALPGAWVARKVDPDYGIDWTVEIFEDGQATGRSFHAQVKGTDERDLDKALGSVRFARDTADYYREQSIPVLIVRYHAPTRRLFTRWFHAYNPRIARTGVDPDARSIGFQLFEQDEVLGDFADQIHSGVEGFLKFRSPELALPLSVAVAPTQPGTFPDARRTALSLRRALSAVSDLVDVEVRDPAPDDPSITIEPERVLVSLADVASVTLDRDGSDDSASDGWAADVVLALAVTLTYVGQANIASQLAAATGALGRVIADLEVALTIAGAMVRSQRVSEAIQLADALDDSDTDDIQFAGFMLLTVLFARRREFQPAEQTLALAGAERRVERRRARDDIEGVAAEAYNLAMLLKRTAQGSEAVRWFREAAEADASYLERDYYHGDLAGALFESGDYDGAVVHYARALEIGGRELDQALLADSLLHAGRYEEAQIEFASYVAETTELHAAEWRLKSKALHLLIDAVGSMQERNVEAAETLLNTWNFEDGPDMSIDEAQASCWKAISLDACCGRAWFRLGLITIGLADSPIAGSAQSIAGAVLSRYALGHWHNAVLCMDPSDESTVRDVFYAGYRLNKAAFVSAVVDAVDAAPHLSAHREFLIRVLDETVVAYEQQRTTDAVVRFRGEDGHMNEIVLSDAQEENSTSGRRSIARWRPPPNVGSGSRSKSTRRPRAKKPGKTHGRTKRRKRKKR